MKYQSKLAIMVIIIALFACVYANQFEYSNSPDHTKTENHHHKHHEKHHHVSCQAVTLAYASCKVGDDACVEYKAKRFDRKCPNLAKSLDNIAEKSKEVKQEVKKESKLAKQEGTPLTKEQKQEKKAHKFSAALLKLKTAADSCPSADKLSKKIHSAIEALKTNPKLVEKLMEKVGKMSTKHAHGEKSSRKGEAKGKWVKGKGHEEKKAVETAKKDIKEATKAARKANATNEPSDLKEAKKSINKAKRSVEKANEMKKKRSTLHSFLELAASSTATTTAMTNVEKPSAGGNLAAHKKGSNNHLNL